MWLTKRLKKYFFRGLAILLPTILTIGILVWGYQFIQENISAPINWGLVRLIILIKGLNWEDESTKAALAKFWVTGPGSIAGFIIAVIVGRKNIDLKKFLNLIFWSIATANRSAAHIPGGTTPRT